MSKSISDRKQKKIAGIRDWKQKKVALHFLFNATKDVPLAGVILTKDKFNRSSRVTTLSGNFKNWHYPNGSNPDGHVGEDFMDNLVLRLKEIGYQGENIHAAFINNTIEQFYKALPEEKRKILPELEENEVILNTDINSDNYHNMWFSRRESIESAKFSLKYKGKIDQKFHYLSPDSAIIWQALITAGEYTQYDECKASLSFLCKGNRGNNGAFEEKGHQIWKNFFTNKNNGVVMLGGGTPLKDIIVIESILNLLPSTDNLNYALVDFSQHMLKSSFYRIDYLLKRKGLRSRVNLSLIEDDFLRFSEIRTLINCENNKIAWIIPGGTIGNVNEWDFFKSVANQSMSGDMLVVAAETISEDNKVNYSFRGKYDIPEVQDFVEAALRSVWHDLEHDKLEHKENFKKALSQIRIVPIDGTKEQNIHSKIPGSTTVEISLPIDIETEEKIVLAISTRYIKENFIAFAESMDFKHKTSVSSPLNDDFNQFVFFYDPST